MTLAETAALQFLNEQQRDTHLVANPALRVWLNHHPRFRKVDDVELYTRARKVSHGRLHAIDRASCIAVLLSNL